MRLVQNQASQSQRRSKGNDIAQQTLAVNKFPESTLTWHGNLRALSFNQASFEMMKVYITGERCPEGGNDIRAQVGTEPSAPRVNQNSDGEILLEAYYSLEPLGNGNPYAL